MLIEHSNKSSHNTQVYLLNLEFEQKLEYCSQSHSSRGLNQNFLLQGRVVTSTLTMLLYIYTHIHTHTYTRLYAMPCS